MHSDDTPGERAATTGLKGSGLVIGGLRIDAGHLRRGALFLVNIGVPLLFGAISGQSQAALAAVIVGMLFGFADNDGPLSSRVRLLFLDAGCIAAGGLIGFLSRNNAAVLWPVFVAITLAVGLAAQTGREWLLAGRHTAMAFVVAVAIPSFTLLEAYYLLGVLLLAAVARTIDHLIAGPLPRQPAPPLATADRQGRLGALSRVALAARRNRRTMDRPDVGSDPYHLGRHHDPRGHAGGRAPEL